LDEYIEQAEYFLKCGVNHFMVKVDSQCGPKMIENLKYFWDRKDLECKVGDLSRCRHEASHRIRS
jgi:hypothetical protein